MASIQQLNQNNFKFKHSLGQNFIFDQNLLQAIANDAGIDKDTTVLEIGTGSGTLTKILAKSAKKIVTVEIDKELIPILNEVFSEFDNIELINNDILKVDLKELEDKLQDNYTIVANLPYYITTPIIFKFLDNSQKINKLAIMVQKEVAERLIAKENTEDYGLLTVSVNAIADVKISRIVKRNMFIPAPNVDSAVVVIDMNHNKYNISSLNIFKQVTKSAFAMRRKTLINNLKSSFNIQTNKLEEILQSLSLPTNIRGEALSVQQFVNLSNKIYEILQ